jgi:vitamin K epoxide reductase
MYKFFAQWFSKQDKRQKIAEISLLTGAGVGLLASFILSIETLVLAKTPNTVLGCDLNAVISCSSVAQHWSASLLGFPNSFIGLMALPVMVTIGVALLAGTKFPRWFMFAAQIGVSIGFIFALWMFYMSYVEIGVLCPWCLTLDVGMLLIFGGMTRYNILTGVIAGKKLKKFAQNDYDIVLLVTIIALAVVMILTKFGEQLL